MPGCEQEEGTETDIHTNFIYYLHHLFRVLLHLAGTLTTREEPVTVTCKQSAGRAFPSGSFNSKSSLMFYSQSGLGLIDTVSYRLPNQNDSQRIGFVFGATISYFTFPVRCWIKCKQQ